MIADLSQITLVLGVDAAHLEELRWVWPTWMKYRRELLQMPAVVFYDPDEVEPEAVTFLHEHPNVRWVPWRMPSAQTQREKMITGWVQVTALEVRTPWYLKLDTDAVATRHANWLPRKWLARDAEGRAPVFIAPAWRYSKPRYVLDLLDDWGDHVPALAKHARLNLPYSSSQAYVAHPRIISWFFLGRTDWTRQVFSWLKEGRLPYPSQDTFLFYCARRTKEHYVATGLRRLGWAHLSLCRLKRVVQEMGLTPAEATRRKTHLPACAPRGVVYYNTGTKCLARMLVSLHSLRRHYTGPVTILSEGEESHYLCKRIAQPYGAAVKEWNCEVPDGPNRVYLAKTRYHTATPYETTIALDADTLILGGLEELFALAEESSFCVSQLGNWQSSRGIIRQRVRSWQPWLPDDIEPALRFGPAINCGVVSFRRDAAILRDWLTLALPGRTNFVPDETCCQVVLHRYAHKVVGGEWNRSCKYDHRADPPARIIHYHGAKHCRAGLPFQAQRWVEVWNEVYAANVARVRKWAPAGDRALRKHLRHVRKSSPAGMAPAPVTD